MPTPEKPILLLDNQKCQWKHHSCGVFTNPVKRSSFEFEEDGGKVSADILKIDSRFVSLLRWLGENHINVCLSGKNSEAGYAAVSYTHLSITFGREIFFRWCFPIEWKQIMKEAFWIPTGYCGQ